MTRDVDRASLYSAPLNLWVEDALTRDYLAEVWADQRAQVKFLIAGGRAGVAAILRDAEEAGYRNVFGYVDRDFGQSNRDRWEDPEFTGLRYVSSVHEIENHLLDPDALGGCSLNTRQLPAESIRDILRTKAEEQTWSYCTCLVLSRLRSLVDRDFPSFPGYPEIKDHDSAVRYLIECRWSRESFPALTGIEIDDWCREDLLRAKQEAETSLSGANSWPETFPGKHVFRELRDRIYLGRSTSRHEELVRDLAKAVATWQRENKRIPPELVILKEALLRRVGLAAEN